MKKTRWAIVGLGKIAAKFAADLQLVPDAQLVAVASRDHKRAEAFGNQFGATHRLGNYENLLAIRDQFDVVYIATPHVLHCGNALFFLKNRIPVLCEKPLGMNASEVELMLKTAAENDVFFMEAMWTRCFPSFQAMQRCVAEGMIGEVRGLSANFGFPAIFDVEKRTFGKHLGGGSWLDIGIYPAVLALTLLGAPVQIQANATFASTGVDDHCIVNLTHQNGEISTLMSSFLSKMPTDAHIFGTKGFLHIHSRFHHAASFSVTFSDESTQHFDFAHEGYGYQFEAAEVGRCLAEGKRQSDRVSWDFSRQLIQLLDDVRLKIGLRYDADFIENT